MNAYQEKLVRGSEKMGTKRIVLRLVSLCLFPVLLIVGYCYSFSMSVMAHGWLDLWMAFYLLGNILNGGYLVCLSLLCRLVFWLTDKLTPILNEFVTTSYSESKLEAQKHITKIRYYVNAMLVKFLRAGCLGKSPVLFLLDQMSYLLLFLVLVSVGYVWTGVFYGLSCGLCLFSISSFKGMIYANVYRLEDTLGGEENLDDLSDQLFHGGR